ncbi:MAG: DUF4340 domain-containing protein [Candidatus Sumerlaeaceae bacterium]
MMSWKRTIFAAVALVLVCMAYRLDVVLRQKKIVDITNAVSLAQGVDVSAVGEILLKNPGGRIRLQRTTDGWRILEPANAPADPETVETTLINLTAARRTNENHVKNLAEYGLANPEIEISLAPMPGKKFSNDLPTSFSLQLGNESPYTGLVFAKYPDKPNVFTVGMQVKSALLRSAGDFRRSRLFDIDTSSLEQYSSLSVRTPTGEVTLRNDVGRWKITSPFEAPAENSIVRDHLNKIGLLRANSFLSQASDKPTSMATALQALTSPSLTITLEGARTRPQTLIVAQAPAENGSVYVAQRAGEQEIMALRAETIEELRQDAQYFRSRDLFTLKPADVGLFTVELGRATPAALIRNDKGAWEMVGDPEFRVDQTAVNDRLEALLRIKVKEFVSAQSNDPRLYGLDVPRRRYTVTSIDKSRTEVLEAGSTEAGRPGTVYARRAGDNGVFTVELSSDLNILAASIADKHFAATDISALVRAEIDVDKQTYTLRAEAGEWQILKPSQTAYAAIDIRRMQAVVDALNELTYERDLTATGQTIIAPKAGPPLSIRLYGAADRELLDLNVTKRLGSTTLVTSAKNRTFEVSSPAIDRLYALAQSLVQ